MNGQSWSEKNCVLYLDRSWKPFQVRTPQDAFVKMTGESPNVRILPLYFEYSQDPDGTYNTSMPINMYPLSFENWLKLTPRTIDRVIHTCNRAIVIPAICVTERYNHRIFEDKVIKKVSKSRIGSASGYMCAYTGKYVPGDKGNVEHVIPRSRGGGDTLDNLVWADREVNSKKANRTPAEAGLPEPKRLTPEQYKMQIKNNFKIPEWEIFLRKD